MLSETCFEIDFNFSDVLSSIEDCSSVTRGKNTDSNCNLNSFSVDNTSTNKLISEFENDVQDDDLSSLLESSHVCNHVSQTSDLISLASLANNHLSNNLSISSRKKTEENLSVSFLTSFENDISDEIQLLDCLEDILLEGKCDTHNKISYPENLSTLNWEYSSIKHSEKNEREQVYEPTKETVDDEMIPDINLSFCIKKNNNDEISPMSTSPESSDSGFDDSDFFSEKCDSGSSDKTSSLESTLFSVNQVKSTLFTTNLSLLSRAISAQPKTDKSRREKLQIIQRELLKKYIPQVVSEVKQMQDLEKFENFTDQSNECVKTSSFLAIGQ